MQTSTMIADDTSVATLTVCAIPSILTLFLTFWDSPPAMALGTLCLAPFMGAIIHTALGFGAALGVVSHIIATKIGAAISSGF